MDKVPSTTQGFRIAALIKGQMAAGLDAAEEAELEAWALESPANAALLAALKEEALHPHKNPLNAYNASEGMRAVQAKIHRQRRIRVRLWWAAAALIPVAISTILFSWPSGKPGKAVVPQGALSVIEPGKQQAILITGADSLSLGLTNDTTYQLAGSSLARQQGAAILMLPGPDRAAATFHTLMTPKGGTYRVVLEDGTTVWLNAASSIRFPANFNNADRQVSVSGEVFFDVAPDRDRPFIVQAGKSSIQVLGTRFNLNSYSDGVLTTTLLSGKVKAITDGKERVLVAGQQAIADDRGITVSDADTLQAAAWKNGRLMFSNARLEAILPEIERWYNVTFEYKNGTDHSSGINIDISREVPLGKVLEMLELTGAARFKISGRTIAVMPN